MSLTWIQHHGIEWFKNLLKVDFFLILKIWNTEITKSKLEVNISFQPEKEVKIELKGSHQHPNLTR